MTGPFNEAQLKVLASACDAAFQATTVDEILPPNASQEQRQQGEQLELGLLRKDIADPQAPLNSQEAC